MAQSQTDKALQVYTPNSPILQELGGEPAKQLINNYLKGSKYTADDLLLDLAAEMTTKPKIAQCSKESLFRCLLFAAKHRATFGKDGVEVVPRGAGADDEDGDTQAKGGRTMQAIPQLGYRKKVAEAKRRGAFHVVAQPVWKGDRYRPIRDGGILVGVEHDPAPDAVHTLENLVCGWACIVFSDGRRLYTEVSRDRIMHSYERRATRGPGIWGSHTEEMVMKTLKHRATEEFVGDFTVGLGGGSDVQLPSGAGEDDPLEIGYEAVDDPGSSAEEIGASLDTGPDPTPEPDPGADEDESGHNYPDAIGPVPAPETFPPAVATRLQEKEWNPVRVAYDILAAAWKDLPIEPTALADAYAQNRQQMVEGASNEDLRKMGQLRQHLWNAAEKAGFPQPAPRR